MVRVHAEELMKIGDKIQFKTVFEKSGIAIGKILDIDQLYRHLFEFDLHSLVSSLKQVLFINFKINRHKNEPVFH